LGGITPLLLTTEQFELPEGKATALRKWLRSSDAALFLTVLESHAAAKELEGVQRVHGSRKHPAMNVMALEAFQEAFRYRDAAALIMAYQQKESFTQHKIITQ
jgi:hypothetical protein